MLIDVGALLVADAELVGAGRRDRPEHRLVTFAGTGFDGVIDIAAAMGVQLVDQAEVHVLAVEAVGVGRHRLEEARGAGLHDPMCQDLDAERPSQVRQPAHHLLGRPERDLGLLARARRAVDLRAALLVGAQHVERGRVRHRRLAVAARHLDVDAPEPPLAVVFSDPTERRGQNEGLPGRQLQPFPGLGAFDVRQELGEAADPLGEQRIEAIGEPAAGERPVFCSTAGLEKSTGW